MTTARQQTLFEGRDPRDTFSLSPLFNTSTVDGAPSRQRLPTGKTNVTGRHVPIDERIDFLVGTPFLPGTIMPYRQEESIPSLHSFTEA